MDISYHIIALIRIHICRYIQSKSIIPSGLYGIQAIPTVPTAAASERHYRSDRWRSAERANDVRW